MYVCVCVCIYIYTYIYTYIYMQQGLGLRDWDPHPCKVAPRNLPPLLPRAQLTQALVRIGVPRRNLNRAHQQLLGLPRVPPSLHKLGPLNQQRRVVRVQGRRPRVGRKRSVKFAVLLLHPREGLPQVHRSSPAVRFAPLVVLVTRKPQVAELFLHTPPRQPRHREVCIDLGLGFEV